MRDELANLNHCAVLFLSGAAVNLSWYDNRILSRVLPIMYVFHESFVEIQITRNIRVAAYISKRKRFFFFEVWC